MQGGVLPKSSLATAFQRGSRPGLRGQGLKICLIARRFCCMAPCLRPRWADEQSCPLLRGVDSTNLTMQQRDPTLIGQTHLNSLNRSQGLGGRTLARTHSSAILQTKKLATNCDQRAHEPIESLGHITLPMHSRHKNPATAPGSCRS